MWRLQVTDALTSTESDQISTLDADAARADRAFALDDQVRLDLQSSHRSVRHVLAQLDSDQRIIGYGHADWRSGTVVNAHFVVDPMHRRRGVGTALLGKLGGLKAALPLRVWAHGDTDAAQAMASVNGLARVRELRRMTLASDIPLPAASYPADTTVRTFVPGQDDVAWVDANAAAFRHHPEQGLLGIDDLHQRMMQPWSDPAGFFVAERDNHVVGFHWTKVHPFAGSQGGAVGEVYVLGVHPDAQGSGLGRALTLTGLHHLRGLGVDEVMLYVESDNAAAVAVYARLGFVTSSVDVMYGKPEAATNVT